LDIMLDTELMLSLQLNGINSNLLLKKKVNNKEHFRSKNKQKNSKI
jgi:hypothetical protein